MKLAIIGGGLIGTSVAHGVIAAGWPAPVLYDAAPDHAKRLKDIGFTVADSAAAAARGAHITLLAVPTGAMGEAAAAVAPGLARGSILTDAGSVKTAVIAAVAPHVPEGVHFIPGHPIAGTELSGPDAGFATLFQGRWAILTPFESSDSSAVEAVETLWRTLGAQVERMSPEHHDLVFAIVSHLPHLIAYTIVGTADHLAAVSQSEVIKFSASGFRDFTRIAASDPVMWRDVFLGNREAVLEMLGRFSEDLTAMQRAIRFGDGDALFAHFTRTRAIRRSIIEAGQDSAVPNFGRDGPAQDPDPGRNPRKTL